MLSRLRLPLASLFVVAATAAEAHPGAAHVHSLAEGLMHPLTGADHLLAMVVVGLIAARARGMTVFAAPAAFLGAMILGAAVGIAGFGAVWAESGIALSLLALGGLAVIARPVPMGVAVLVAGAAGLTHGLAHGLEAPLGGATAAYLAGFVSATALLHAIGLVAGRGLRGRAAAGVAGLASIGLGLAALAGVV